jgi:hypothetical protein
MENPFQSTAPFCCIDCEKRVFIRRRKAARNFQTRRSSNVSSWCCNLLVCRMTSQIDIYSIRGPKVYVRRIYRRAALPAEIVIGGAIKCLNFVSESGWSEQPKWQKSSTKRDCVMEMLVKMMLYTLDSHSRLKVS